jgi:hypothetical protein
MCGWNTLYECAPVAIGDEVCSVKPIAIRGDIFKCNLMSWKVGKKYFLTTGAFGAR